MRRRLVLAKHDEVHLNLDGDVPDYTTYSKNRHGLFCDSDLLRKLFKTLVARCMKEEVVGGEAFAVEASMVVADAHRGRCRSSQGFDKHPAAWGDERWHDDLLRRQAGLPGLQSFPQLSRASFLDRGVICSEGPDQPAELGSPTAIGNFGDTDRSDSFGAGLAPQSQRFDLPKFRDNFLRAAFLSCH
jgi:hypothetical protein